VSDIPRTKRILRSLPSRRAGRLIAKRWRERLGYLALSLFIGWHTIAMMLVPVPQNNPIVRAFRALYQPYLTSLGLDTTWDFFSPIGWGHQFAYVIEDADGKEHAFMPILEVNWLLATRRWSERVFETVMNEPHLYGGYFAAAYCRKHASLKPVAVTLLEIPESRYWPDDHLSGNRPNDPAYMLSNLAVHNPLIRFDCLQK